MAIQYSGGTVINRLGALTTRTDWCNFVTQALSDAGWTTVAGTPGAITPAGFITQDSAAGNLGQKVRVQVNEIGSGTCAQAFLRHSSGSPLSQAFFANPPFTWRIIANKFHFFCFVSGSSFRLTSRTNVCGGVLYAPTFATLSSGDGNSWMQGNATSDADLTNHSSWRTTLRSYDVANSGGRFSGIYVNSITEGTAYTNNIGAMYIACWQGGYNQTDQGFRWEDTTLSIYEPIVGWGTGGGLNNEGRHKGQIYDAVVVNGSWTSETQITFDGHTWMAYTDTPTSAIACDATLFLLIA